MSLAKAIEANRKRETAKKAKAAAFHAGECDRPPIIVSEMKGDDVLRVIPHNFNGLMTGTKCATIDQSGLVTLTYTDDTTESAQVVDPNENVDDIEYTALVGRVQAATT